MSDPALGPGTALDSNGNLIISGARSGTWDPAQGDIAAANALRVDATSGQAWVHPPFRRQFHTLTPAAPLNSSKVRWRTQEALEGGISTNVSNRFDADYADANNASSLIQVTGLSTFIWTNPISETVTWNMTTSGTLGAILADVSSGLGGLGVALLGTGIRNVLTINGTEVARWYTEMYNATSFGAVGGVANVGAVARKVVWGIPPKAQAALAIDLYFRSALNASINSQGTAFWCQPVTHIDVTRETDFTAAVVDG